MSDVVNDLPAVATSAVEIIPPRKRRRSILSSALSVISGTRLSAMVGYDGGDRMRMGRWGEKAYGPDRLSQTYVRDLNRVRQQIAKNPVAKRSRNAKVTDWIGDQGFIPRLDPYPEINARWIDWSESTECDANGRVTLLGMQKQLGNGLAGDAGIMFRFRDRDPNNVFDRALTKVSGVGFQVQPLEIDHLVLGRNQVEANGTVTIDGENRSQYNGAILGYYIYRRHPQARIAVPAGGDNLPVWIPAADMLRIDLVDRIGAPRSEPLLRTILPTLKDRYDYLDAEIVRKGVAARRTYVIKMPGMPNDIDNLRAILGAQGGEIEGETEDGRPVVSMPETGEALALPAGWDMQALDPADVGEGFLPFMKIVGQEIAAGTDQPYVKVSMDTEGLNDRMARWLDIQTERDIGFDQEEYFIRRFMRPVWRRWLLRAFYVDEVFDPKKYDIEALLRVGFSYPKRAYVNRLQDAQADDARLKAGTTSRTRIMESEGEDPSKIAMERAMEAAMDRQLQPGSEFSKIVDAKALERLKSMLNQAD